MLPVKLVRSMVLGEPINNPLFESHPPPHHPHHHHHHHDNVDDEEQGHTHDDDDDAAHTHDPHHHQHGNFRSTRNRRRRAQMRTPLLRFTPTMELVRDTYHLASIARDIGMDLYPNASLSHIIFSWPSPSSSSSPFPHHLHSLSSSLASTPFSPSSSSCRPSFSSTSSASSSSYLCSLPNNAVPLPFPSLSTASISLLRFFVAISKGLFQLGFLDLGPDPGSDPNERFSSWDCSSLSLVCRISGKRVEDMDGFCRVLAGNGWTLYKTGKKLDPGPGCSGLHGSNSVYLFRKSDPNRVRTRGFGGEGRIRELRLPALDFNNVPLRILQYILLMTDDIFHLA